MLLVLASKLSAVEGAGTAGTELLPDVWLLVWVHSCALAPELMVPANRLW